MFVELVDAIPESTRTPLGLLAFLALVGTVAFVASRTRRIRSLTRALKDLPAKDRKDLLISEMNQPLPDSISPEAWIRHQLYKYLLTGFISVLLLCAFLSILFIDKDPMPRPKDAENVARDTLTAIYERKDDNRIYDRLLEANKASYGSLASFRRAVNIFRAQLTETPVQRRQLSGDVSPSSAIFMFEAETDSGMKWREAIQLEAVAKEWKVGGFQITPMEWASINLPYIDQTLPAFVSAQPVGTTGVIPLPGWQVRTGGHPVPSTMGKEFCDVPLESAPSVALMKDVYGACTLAPGAKLIVLGVATRTDSETTISQVRFYPQ